VADGRGKQLRQEDTIDHDSLAALPFQTFEMINRNIQRRSKIHKTIRSKARIEGISQLKPTRSGQPILPA